MVPEQHAQHAGNRKNQGKPKEVPFLPEPVDIRCTKQLHENSSSQRQLLVAGCQLLVLGSPEIGKQQSATNN
jgi:hypothetical protein